MRPFNKYLIEVSEFDSGFDLKNWSLAGCLDYLYDEFDPLHNNLAYSVHKYKWGKALYIETQGKIAENNFYGYFCSKKYNKVRILSREKGGKTSYIEITKGIIDFPKFISNCTCFDWFNIHGVNLALKVLSSSDKELYQFFANQDFFEFWNFEDFCRELPTVGA